MKTKYFLGLLFVAAILALGLTTKNLDELHKQASVAKSLAESVAIEKKREVINRTNNVSTWCNGINSVIKYNREYLAGSLKQSEAQAKVIDKAVEGRTSLTPEQVRFVRLYVDSVVALEKQTPAIANLKPYMLKELDCAQLEKNTAQSGHK